MSSDSERPRSWKRTGLLLLGLVAGPPASFVLLSPVLALAGYLTGWLSIEKGTLARITAATHINQSYKWQPS